MSAPALCALALLSIVVLAFEVFLTRLLAYSVFIVLVYVVLGIAMLGFGAAGSLVAVRSHWLEAEQLPRALAWAALGFAASLVLPIALFVRITHRMLEPDPATFIASALLTLPFLCAGIVVALALSANREQIGRCYAANLIGSGLGCFVPLLALGPLDGEGVLALMGILAWLAAALFVWNARVPLASPLSLALWGSAVVVAASAVFAPAVFAIQIEPEPYGQLARINRFAEENAVGVVKRYDRWNPTGRIEIFEYTDVPGAPNPYPFLYYAHDSSAGSILTQWDGRDIDQVRPTAADPGTTLSRLCTQTLFGQGYFAPRAKVLVIGLGGGPDVQCALYHRASEVDVVEINEDSIAAVRGPFNEWLGGVGRDPRVRYYERDGRSFAHGARGDDYDLVQLSGVDTKSGLASGAFALSENHLYTEEAFTDYLGSLSDEGIVAIARFGEWEALRLANTAVSALRGLGVEHPERHIAVIRDGVIHGVLVGRMPFGAAQVRALRERFDPENEAHRGVWIFFYELFGFVQRQIPEMVYTPGGIERNNVTNYFEAVAQRVEHLYEAQYVYDISTTTDDRPFFFDAYRYDRAEAWDALHVQALLAVLGSILVLSALLILAPVWRLRGAGGVGGSLRALSYFAAVGLAFLLVEVWMLHRFSMYLGHQSYSLAIVLSTLLLFSGIGAVLGEGLIPASRPRILAGCGFILVWLLLGLTTLGFLVEASWESSLWGRGALVVLYVAPCGIAMGFPFPAGLRWVSATAPRSVAWCVGINAFASVLATVIVIPLSMALGYTVVALIGIGLYASAALVALGMHEPAVRAAS